ncbi:MAG: hypothetical protein ACK4RK_19230 [Gemmataceae bacterium]
MKNWAIWMVATLGTIGWSNHLPSANAYHATNGVGLITSYYHQYLGRCPDAPGLNYWLSKLSCWGPEEVRMHILASDEYFLRSGCCPNAFVARLYVDVLGRAPSPCEVRLWASSFPPCGCRKAFVRRFLCAAQQELNAVVVPVAPPVVVQPVYAPPVYQPVPVVVPAPVPMVVPHRGYHPELPFHQVGCGSPVGRVPPVGTGYRISVGAVYRTRR